MVGTESGRWSAEELVEVVVRADPEPSDRLSMALGESPEGVVDPDGPDLFVAGEFLEAK